MSLKPLFRMFNVKIIALLLLCFTSLYSCSKVEFAYNQLDWLIPYYVGGYIDLTDFQDEYLDEEVGVLLNWHCSAHLASYAKLLRSANKQFQSGTLEVKDLEHLTSQFELYWKEILQQTSPSIVRLLHSFTPQQVINMQERFAADNRIWYETYKEVSLEETQEGYRETLQDELEHWFDELTEQQTEQVHLWSTQFKTLGREGQLAREKWQKQFLKLLETRDDIELLRRNVEALFVHPETLRSQKYQDRLKQNKRYTINLIYQISKSLSREQLENLDSMITTISTSFDNLACKKPLQAQIEGI